jgi:Flp pilus assembly protein TadB
MRTITSFRTAEIRHDQLGPIMSDYLALERARMFRRLLVKRVGVLAVVVGVVASLWLSRFVFWFSLGLCAAVLVWAWILEMGVERRLARRLDGLPTHTAELRVASKKVIKSS